jgi:hypothetical protein
MITGTATKDSNGQITFRDRSGRTTGTANTDSNGQTTFRDGSGRTTGTARPTQTARQRSVTPRAGPPAQLRRRGDEPVQTGLVAGDGTFAKGWRRE